MYDVVVIGSLMLDKVSRVGRLPRPSENVYASSKAVYLGGKGFNQALAAHRFGAKTLLVGCVGDDEGWDLFREALDKEGMDANGLHKKEQATTGQADIWVQKDGLNMICAYPGANDLLHPDDFLQKTNEGRYLSFGAGVVLSQLEVPDVAARQRCGWTSILNPAPMRLFDRSMLQDLDYITPNESEVFALTGIEPVDDASCAAAGRKLIDEGVKAVIITLGARGCYWVTERQEIHFLAPAVKAVDTTAAGDVFNGVLSAMVRGIEKDHAVRYALAAASLSTTRPGAAPSVPTRTEVEAFMATF
ncbi:MAG: ribokinase [Armatimonadetes bacterium]|nr:ribokinase [Armatimonadota bacterium]